MSHPANLTVVAARDIDRREATRNRAPWIEKYWADTTYPKGHENREPYCAAAVAYWLAQWGRELRDAGQLRATTGMSWKEFEGWRCKSALAFAWARWGAAKQKINPRRARVLPRTAKPPPGSLVVFNFSGQGHIGVVTDATSRQVATIEANTNAAGSRDGDGCFIKARNRSVIQCFVELFPQ